VYFAALLARTEDGWKARDTELDNVETLADLAELAREAMTDEETVLAWIEQEDSWFGVVRVDGEDDPRIYVSDAASASRSSYGAMLTDELVGRDLDDLADLDDLDTLDLDGTEDGEDEEAENDDSGPDSDPIPAGPLGEADLLDDLGISEKQLLSLSSDGEPGEALSVIAEALGCEADLEAVR
jgi:putative tRNA adenosine deaminase-associated protein